MMKQLIPIYGLEMEGSADHAVKIRSEGKGIYLQSTPGAARLTVDGDVDIEAPSGIVVDRGEAGCRRREN